MTKNETIVLVKKDKGCVFVWRGISTTIMLEDITIDTPTPEDKKYWKETHEGNEYVDWINPQHPWDWDYLRDLVWNLRTP